MRKSKQTSKKIHENEYVKGKYTDIFAYVYIYTPTDIQTYTNTDTHILINTLCVIQVRYSFQAKILGYSIYALINPFTGR